MASSLHETSLLQSRATLRDTITPPPPPPPPPCASPTPHLGGGLCGLSPLHVGRLARTTLVTASLAQFLLPEQLCSLLQIQGGWESTCTHKPPHHPELLPHRCTWAVAAIVVVRGTFGFGGASSCMPSSFFCIPRVFASSSGLLPLRSRYAPPSCKRRQARATTHAHPNPRMTTHTRHSPCRREVIVAASRDGCSSGVTRSLNTRQGVCWSSCAAALQLRAQCTRPQRSRHCDSQDDRIKR